MEKILSVLNSNITKYALILVIFIFFIGTCNKNLDLKKESKITTSNIEALKDSISIVKKKNGEIYASISGYQSSIKDLQLYNQKLYNEAKAQSGKIVSINNLVLQLKQDTTILRKALREHKYYPPVITKDGDYSIKWSLEYRYDSLNYDRFTGNTVIRFKNKTDSANFSHEYTELLSRETQIDLVYGQKYENKKLKVFVQSKYPGFTPRSLEGVYVTPKESHWFTGMAIGPSFTIGYDVMEQKPKAIFGISLQYNIYKW